MADTIVSSVGGFNFSNGKIQKTISSGSFLSTYSATAGDSVIGNTGNRIWDTNVKAASGTHLITPTSPLVIPLTNAFLPTKRFDAIIDLIIDGESIPLAFSNSPENQVTSRTFNSPNLYWLNLCRCHYNLPTAPNSQAAIDYHFGTNQLIYTTASGSTDTIKINLLKPLTQPTTFNWTFNLFQTFNTVGNQQFSGGATIPAGAATRNIQIGTFPNYFWGATTVGYIRMTIACSDPTIRSLLPYYHWGASP